MTRLQTVLALGGAALAALAVMQPSARATDAACKRWEVKVFPMKPEQENALRLGKDVGPLGMPEGWEPFATVEQAVAARRCAP